MNQATRCALAWLICLFAGTGLALSGTALAQPWPSKPVRVIVPFAPGGPTDIVARLLGQKLSESLGQQMVIESRAGAGGNVGTAAVAKSPPDGYSVLITSSAFAVNVSLSPNAGYGVSDFVPVANLAKQANMIYAHPDLPAKTLAELLALARGGKMAYASPGNGTTPHLTAENLFNVTAKLDVTAIHFRGAGQAVVAVIGGEPRIGVGAISGPLAQIKAGKLRGIAVSSATRIAALPDVPTFAESGFPGVEDYTWIGMFVPAGTPPAIVQRLNEATNQALRTPELRERLEAVAFEPVGGSAQQFADYLKVEIPKWGKVVREGNIKAE
jgi:tripartite-type tricarboxylate transporter receptor subunit TctC